MRTFWDIANERDIYERYGMNVKLKLPRTSLYDFRIAFGNDFTKNSRDGITTSTGDLEPYTLGVVQQITELGFFIKKSDGFFSKDCFYVYRSSKDVDKEYPRTKVYIHPNEMAGWASQKEIEKFLDIVNTNRYLSNVRIVYKRRVYNIDDARYLDILKEAEEQILIWLVEFKKHHKRNMSIAGERFNAIFGIKRLQTKHLSHHDYVAINYINQLVEKV